MRERYINTETILLSLGWRCRYLMLAAVFAAAGCSTMNGVNVNTGINLPGGVGVGASKTIGQGQDGPSSRKDQKRVSSNIKLYVFDCGVIRMEDVATFGLSNNDTAVRELFVPCYLIEHPEGRLLWDAGLAPQLAGRGEQPLQEGATQEYQTRLVQQLAEMNLRPGDIDYVAFSHMHFDHVGSANAFVDSTLLIQEAEYEAAFKHPEDNPIFDYSLYEQLADSTKTLLSGDYDVFGDGKVKIVSAPGHTPGHQVLYLYLSNLGPLVLGGDLYHFEASRELRSVPEFNTDKAQTLESMDKVERLIKNSNATLWIEHNMELAQKLNLAPAYYD